MRALMKKKESFYIALYSRKERACKKIVRSKNLDSVSSQYFNLKYIWNSCNMPCNMPVIGLASPIGKNDHVPLFFVTITNKSGKVSFQQSPIAENISYFISNIVQQ